LADVGIEDIARIEPAEGTQLRSRRVPWVADIVFGRLPAAAGVQDLMHRFFQRTAWAPGRTIVMAQDVAEQLPVIKQVQHRRIQQGRLALGPVPVLACGAERIEQDPCRSIANWTCPPACAHLR
jgi:hypothetical protein